MAYRLRVDEPFEAGVRRVASEQIDRALADLDPGHPDRDATIHDARRRIKRVRALMRLVDPMRREPFLGEDARLRAAARRLSPARDAAVTIQTYDAVMNRFGEDVDRRAFGPIRRVLTVRYREIVARGDANELVEKSCSDLLATRAEAQRWSFDAGGFDAVSGGLRRTYRRGRRAMSAAYRESGRRRFHDWRRFVRYHALHMALLRDIWSRAMRARWREVDRLGDTLGAEHDLAVLSRLLIRDERLEGLNARDPFRALLRRRRKELQARARPLGRRIYAERAGRLTDRFGRYWDARLAERGLGEG